MRIRNKKFQYNHSAGVAIVGYLDGLATNVEAVSADDVRAALGRTEGQLPDGVIEELARGAGFDVGPS